jgi:putative transposase
VVHEQGFRVELAPDAGQAVLIGRHAGLSRVVENFCLETVRRKYAQRKAEESYGVSGDELTVVPWSAPALEREWRAAHPVLFPWFTEGQMSSRVPKEACRVRAAGFANYFRSKNSRTVRVPAMGDVATREDMSWLTDRIATGKARILGATVRERAGRWWISFQTEIDRDEVNERRRVDEHAPQCGIDLGLTTFAVIRNSDGTKEAIHAPKPLKTAQRALKRANRRLARTGEDSANRAKARTRVARLHLRVTDRRRDFLHKTTTRLARTKSAIAVETLNAQGMVRNRRLARAVADAGFGEFVRQLDYKTAWYSSRLWKADRWFPSSKMCGAPACGRVDRTLGLADRMWTCAGCGTVHDRDDNAAGNLLTAMLADTARPENPRREVPRRG